MKERKKQTNKQTNKQTYEYRKERGMKMKEWMKCLNIQMKGKKTGMPEYKKERKKVCKNMRKEKKKEKHVSMIKK